MSKKYVHKLPLLLDDEAWHQVHVLKSRCKCDNLGQLIIESLKIRKALQDLHERGFDDFLAIDKKSNLEVDFKIKFRK